VAVCFPPLTLVLFVFLLGWSKRVKLSCPIALLKSFRFLEWLQLHNPLTKILCFQFLMISVLFNFRYAN
jgi:hypothetical protein